MEINICRAKTKLIAAAESGEEIIIARAGKPAVKLVAVPQPARKSRKQMLGARIGKIWTADDWDCPETNLEVQRLFEVEDEKDSPA